MATSFEAKHSAPLWLCEYGTLHGHPTLLAVKIECPQQAGLKSVKAMCLCGIIAIYSWTLGVRGLEAGWLFVHGTRGRACYIRL